MYVFALYCPLKIGAINCPIKEILYLKKTSKSFKEKPFGAEHEPVCQLICWALKSPKKRQMPGWLVTRRWHGWFVRHQLPERLVRFPGFANVVCVTSSVFFPIHDTWLESSGGGSLSFITWCYFASHGFWPTYIPGIVAVPFDTPLIKRMNRRCCWCWGSQLDEME